MRGQIPAIFIVLWLVVSAATLGNAQEEPDAAFTPTPEISASPPSPALPDPEPMRLPELGSLRTDVRIRALRAVIAGELGLEHSQAALAIIAARFPHDEVEEALLQIDALEYLGPMAIPTLARAVSHPSSTLARRAIIALGRFGPLSRPYVVPLVEAHRRLLLRHDASAALASIGSPTRADMLALGRYHANEEWEVFLAARGAIERYDFSEPCETLFLSEDGGRQLEIKLGTPIGQLLPMLANWGYTPYYEPHLDVADYKAGAYEGKAVLFSSRSPATGELIVGLVRQDDAYRYNGFYQWLPNGLSNGERRLYFESAAHQRDAAAVGQAIDRFTGPRAIRIPGNAFTVRYVKDRRGSTLRTRFETKEGTFTVEGDYSFCYIQYLQLSADRTKLGLCTTQGNAGWLQPSFRKRGKDTLFR